MEGIPTDSGITNSMSFFPNDRSWLLIEFRYGIPGIARNSYQFRNNNVHGLICEGSVLAVDRIPLRNSRNCKDQESIRNWTEFPESEGIPTNSHEFRNYNLHRFNSERSVLAIDRIPLRNSRNRKDQESTRNGLGIQRYHK